MRPARSLASPARGFTLLELMTVVAITGIFATLAVANLQTSVNRQRGLGAMQELGMQALKARQLARTTGQPVRFWVGVQGIRWERLPCTDNWGTTCPQSACKTSACGSGGCICQDVGPWVAVPPSITLAPSLSGLCWVGGSAQPTLRQGGQDCDVTGALTPPTRTELTMKQNGLLATVLTVDPLTGMSQVVDCQAVSHDTSACP